MNISIRTIPHADQLYETVGNYFLIPNETDVARRLDVVVSDLRDWKMEFLIGIHETIESALMLAAGIPLIASTDFDVLYEAARPDEDGWRNSDAVDKFRAVIGPEDPLPTRDSEPGDHPASPYKRQHCFATAVERLLAAELAVDWEAYTIACENAGKPKA
jgi:hypothetical protein